MTTTATRPHVTATRGATWRGTALRADERAGARLAGRSLLVMVALALPAAWLLDVVRPGAGTVVLGTAFLLVAVLDVLVAWGLFRTLRHRAGPAALATLVGRAGYAAVLAVVAVTLAWPGGGGVSDFRAGWTAALLAFGVSLVVTAAALRRSRVAPLAVTAATALAGLAYVLDDVLVRTGAQAWRLVLVPVMLGELVLMAWLLAVGRRRAT